MIQRLRRYIKTRCFVLDNVHSDENGEASKLHRKNRNWEPEKDRRPLEGVINRFEQALRVEFSTLKKSKISNLTKVQKIILNYMRNQKELQTVLADKKI